MRSGTGLDAVYNAVAGFGSRRAATGNRARERTVMARPEPDKLPEAVLPSIGYQCTCQMGHVQMHRDSDGGWLASG